MKKRRSNIDEPRVRDVGATSKSRPPGDHDSVQPVRATPFGCLRRPVFPNDERWLISIFGEARLSREKAVLTPPVEDKVSAFVGEGTVKDFVAAVDAVNDWFTRAWIP